ncbi:MULTISPECIES: hypothetical protein [Micrococcales]|jgi:hypothetical protein|uniref:Serine/arginine repetitive matrix protein 2 n=1 Tax=Arthrobacter russicus TaxID=172040 RepID=A0ABU1JAP3_9MICC|nr:MULTISPECIES: hypothetical protein [Micrococcales]EXJ50880.1 hypothetical protein AS96_12420 [Microbacterium sp. MRS-1]MDR6268472.1 hypothetical protein [Arthrobacter russicus]RBO70826.1 hypothetical protein DSP71_19975 [Microbacterium sp. H6]
MTTTSHANAPQTGGEDFTTSEGLRALLQRLHEEGRGAWQHDPVAAALMEHTARKYVPLARRHGLDPWEAATAAFEEMRRKGAREADDPWAYVTKGVQVTCIFEERAQGLMCSVHQARRPHISVFHDPERFSDRETPLSDYHPAFQIPDPQAAEEDEPGEVAVERAGKAGKAVEDAIDLVSSLDWPADVARAAVEHVCTALMRAGTRQAAYENLRRDRHSLALLDLPQSSWTALLRALLGNPNPAYAATSAGRGVLLRLLLEEPPEMLLRDDDLVLTISLAAPIHGRRRTRGETS